MSIVRIRRNIGSGMMKLLFFLSATVLTYIKKVNQNMLRTHEQEGLFGDTFKGTSLTHIVYIIARTTFFFIDKTFCRVDILWIMHCIDKAFIDISLSQCINKTFGRLDISYVADFLSFQPAKEPIRKKGLVTFAQRLIAKNQVHESSPQPLVCMYLQSGIFMTVS